MPDAMPNDSDARASIGVLGLMVAWLAIAGLGSHAPAGQGASPSAERAPARVEAKPGPSVATLTALRDGLRIDLNRMSASDLELLPGIGPRLAQRIVDARTQRGGSFADHEQLRDVHGIGPAKLEALRKATCIGAGCARAH